MCASCGNRVFGQAVDQLPVDGLLAIPRHADLSYLRLTLTDGLVAIHAQLYVW